LILSLPDTKSTYSVPSVLLALVKSRGATHADLRHTCFITRCGSRSVCVSPRAKRPRRPYGLVPNRPSELHGAGSSGSTWMWTARIFIVGPFLPYNMSRIWQPMDESPFCFMAATRDFSLKVFLRRFAMLAP